MSEPAKETLPWCDLAVVVAKGKFTILKRRTPIQFRYQYQSSYNDSLEGKFLF